MAILNDEPVVGPYGVNKEGSGDMYYKGSNMLNMIRTIVDNDELWRNMLRGLNLHFYHQTVTYDQVVGYLQQRSGKDLMPIFDQYLHYKNIPVLELRSANGKTYARWIADAANFHMPVRVRLTGGNYQFIEPTTAFQAVNIPGVTKENLEIDTFNYYIGVLID